ncbi:MAG: hypothetical protein PVI88_00315 [Nitrosopumilaceae archaeon]|jgi:hypothetical protein
MLELMEYNKETNERFFVGEFPSVHDCYDVIFDLGLKNWEIWDQDDDECIEKKHH